MRDNGKQTETETQTLTSRQKKNTSGKTDISEDRGN